jgi:hypothetical protein
VPSLLDSLVLRPAIDCPPGREYTESAFLYFLSLERARAQHARGALRLLLATLEADPGTPDAMPRATATRVFAALRTSMRDTDVMGWYRQDRIAGVVLSERAGAASADGAASLDVPGAIQARVEASLRERLPWRDAARLRLRVVQVPAAFGSRRVAHA